MSELFDPQEMQHQLSTACEKVVREHHIAIDGLTEKQVAEAFKQAVLAGDFHVNVVARPPMEIPVWNGTLDLSAPRSTFETHHSQSVVYLPGLGMDELRAKLERMQKCVDALKEIRNKGGKYFTENGHWVDYDGVSCAAIAEQAITELTGHTESES